MVVVMLVEIRLSKHKTKPTEDPNGQHNSPIDAAHADQEADVQHQCDDNQSERGSVQQQDGYPSDIIQEPGDRFLR